MIMKMNIIKYFEKILLTIVWILLVSTPFLFHEWEYSVWRDLLPPMITTISLFIIFIINRFFLVPKILLKKKYHHYIASVIVMITLSTLIVFALDDGRSNTIPVFDKGMPNEGIFDNKPPHHDFHHSNENSKQRPLPQFAHFLMFAILLIGFDTGLRISFKLSEAEKEKAKLEKQNLETQLAFLRNQISPHFFMNTLNNIHSLIEFDSDKAKDSIIQLSKLMRHLLYDAEIELIPIRKEVEFINNYIELMKLRFSKKIIINVSIPEHIPEKSIPPLLFTSFLENAFKHGISYQKASEISISIKFQESKLIFTIENNYYRTEIHNDNLGIGIENSRKRLDLIYGNKYSLEINDNNNIFKVSLIVPL